MEGEWTVLSKGKVEIVVWSDQAVVLFCTNTFTSHIKGSLIRKVPAKDLPGGCRSDKSHKWVRFEVPYVCQAYNQGAPHNICHIVLYSSSYYLVECIMYVPVST